MTRKALVRPGVGLIFIVAVYLLAGHVVGSLHGGYLLVVVGTVKNGIIDPALIADTARFVWLMMAALLAGALWLNIATALGAPVSTTHSIVGGAIAAAFLYLIKRTITYRQALMPAARRIVPLLLGIVSWSFGTYLVLKGLKHLCPVDFPTAVMIGAVLGLLTMALTRPLIARASQRGSDDKPGVNRLFNAPLVFAAASPTRPPFRCG